MKKIIYTLLSFLLLVATVNAQKGIDYNLSYAAGGRLLMKIDSSSRNVYYDNVFPNQPNTSFNYLPEINNVSVQLYFKPKDNIADYRYSILVDDKVIVVDKPIDKTKLKPIDRPDEINQYTTLGVFPIKGKTITILVYNIEKPLDGYKSIFYGKPIPKAEVNYFTNHLANNKGTAFGQVNEPIERINFTFTDKDAELSIVKNVTDIDYLYYLSIKDKRTDKIIFESTSWLYGGYLNEAGKYSPYVNIDKSVFKKSGDYEVIIQPLMRWDNCFNCDMSAKDIEEHTSRFPLSITLDAKSYSKKELLIYTLIVASAVGLVFLVILYFIKKRSKTKLADTAQQQNIAKLKLSSIRSQLNPHFLFNALSGIQNLMNKNEIDNANKYLAKFARLTRNVLDDKELVSLSQEKALLDDYLQMEQLRFGFTYEITASENLAIENIEIPSMLLQPFVENAVKHGISQKASHGIVRVSFNKQENNLVLTVKDNGNGFDTAKKNIGLGLKLSDSRVALLNSIYQENPIILAIQTTPQGTEISLTLTDWL